MNSQSIGVMDSGVGGISVLKHIHALLPHENLIYFADSKYAPYGSKTPEEIIARCMEIADFLLQKDIKALVVACNTATAAAIDELRETFDIPIIGMEPAVKPAAAQKRPICRAARKLRPQCKSRHASLCRFGGMH
jgi:glutamate racemase